MSFSPKTTDVVIDKSNHDQGYTSYSNPLTSSSIFPFISSLSPPFCNAPNLNALMYNFLHTLPGPSLERRLKESGGKQRRKMKHLRFCNFIQTFVQHTPHIHHTAFHNPPHAPNTTPDTQTGGAHPSYYILFVYVIILIIPPIPPFLSCNSLRVCSLWSVDGSGLGDFGGSTMPPEVYLPDQVISSVYNVYQSKWLHSLQFVSS